jgi:hypothetical protein
MAMAIILLGAGVLLGNGMLLVLGLVAAGIAVCLLSDKDKREV